MDAWDIKDCLHRTAKMAMDTGEAKTKEDAEKLFSSYKLAIEAGPDIATSTTRQAMLLTAVNAGRRCFLGGVQVAGNLNVPLKIGWKDFNTLADAVQDLQGRLIDKVSPEMPRIVIGDARPVEEGHGFSVQATFDGWSGGVVCLEEDRLPESKEFAPAGVLAGAVAVAEAFQFIRGNVLAGRRNAGLSIWDPKAPWRDNNCAFPSIERLPSKLWLIGLGHLGQSFLWTLGFLPYKNPGDVFLVLQDYDKLVPANDSTSPLTFQSIVGMMKTRAMAEWCEKRGFSSRIYERRFSANFKVAADEPGLAVCGVDNAKARAEIEEVGFDRIVEAGLGKGTEEYLALQMHSFPGLKKAKSIWQAASEGKSWEKVIEQPAYKDLGQKKLDQCGLTMLAGRSVGASFVGIVTSCLIIGEILRMINGGPQYAVIDGSLRSLDNISAILNRAAQPYNPGYTNMI